MGDNEESMMIDIAELRQVFAEKLAATGSLDAAFTKAVWVTYQRCMAMKGDVVAHKSQGSPIDFPKLCEGAVCRNAQGWTLIHRTPHYATITGVPE